jgi:hypothetical protein
MMQNTARLTHQQNTLKTFCPKTHQSAIGRKSQDVKENKALREIFPKSFARANA